MRRRALLFTPAVAAVAGLLTSPRITGIIGTAYASDPKAPGTRIRERTIRPVSGKAHADGRPAVRGVSTQALATKPQKTRTLTVGLLDRSGVPASAAGHPNVIVQNLDRGDVFFWGDPGAISLPEGRYAVTADIATSRPDGDPSYTIITLPELYLDRDRTVVLDAREGRRVSAESDNPAAHGGAHDVVVLTQVTDTPWPTALRYVFDPRFDEVYAATVPGTQSATYAFGQTRRATEPTLELVAAGLGSFTVRAEWLDSGFEAPVEQADLIAVHGGAGTADDLAKVDLTGRLVVVEVPGDLAYPELLARLTAMRDRAARLVLVIPRGDASAFADGDLSVLPLPVLVGWGATADRFAAGALAGGQRVVYASDPRPRSRYELAYGVTGQLTTPQVYRPSTASLAAVCVSYHDSTADAARLVNAAQPFFGSLLRTMWSTPTAAPQQRVEYFTPGQWQLTISPYGRPGSVVTDTYDLHAGLNPPIAWDKPVFSPSLRGTAPSRSGERPWAYRDGDAVDVILPMFGDAAGRPQTPSLSIDTGTISLYREDVLVGSVSAPNAARFAVPPEAATYRLTATVLRDQPWWPLSPRVDAEWTFRSSAADSGTPLPLLTVRFDPALSTDNRAPGGPFAFTATVEQQGAGPVDAQLAVEASFDDGITWRPTTVSGAGGLFTVRVVQPGSGYASLRAVATMGTTRLQQTVLRAYALGK